MTLPNLRNMKRSKYSLDSAGQDLYEFLLFQYIKDQVEDLGLDKSFEASARRIYKDALKAQGSFSSLYRTIGVKEPKVVSAALIYLSVQERGYSPSFPKFVKHFSNAISRSSVGQAHTSLFRTLISAKEYTFLYEFGSFALLKDRYKLAIETLIKIYGKRLSSKKLILREEVKNILSLFRKNREILERETTSHYLKNPKYTAAVFCHAYLLFFKDLDIPLVDFSNMIELKTQSTLQDVLSDSKPAHVVAPDSLRKSKPEFIKIYYRNDPITYRKRIVHHLEETIEILKKWFSSRSIQHPNTITLLKQLNQSFLQECVDLFDAAVKYGFKPSYWGKNDMFYYYTPRIAALTLVYFTGKARSLLKKHITKQLFKSLKHEGLILKHENLGAEYIWRNDNWLHAAIREVKKTKGQRYTRNYFVSRAKHLLKKFYHEETDFLLQLYTSTDLEPQEFAEKLNIYGNSTTFLVQLMEEQNKFTEARTFHAIQDFVLKHISLETRKKFIAWLKRMQQTRCTYLRHNHFCYQFKYNSSKVESRPALNAYLNTIYEGRYPREKFGDPNSLGISDLKFRGSRTDPLLRGSIRSFFKDELSEIDDQGLTDLTKAVFKRFKENKMGCRPDHPSIQAHILRCCDKAFAVEVPVWLENLNNKNAFTGHIDLLLIKGNTMVVADYKRDESEMLKTIPQVTAYALVLQYRLKKLNARPLEFKCASFTKDHYIEWDPRSVFEKIVEFTTFQDASRTAPLKYCNSKFNATLLSVLEALKCSLEMDLPKNNEV